MHPSNHAFRSPRRFAILLSLATTQMLVANDTVHTATKHIRSHWREPTRLPTTTPSLPNPWFAGQVNRYPTHAKVTNHRPETVPNHGQWNTNALSNRIPMPSRPPDDYLLCTTDDHVRNATRNGPIRHSCGKPNPIRYEKQSAVFDVASNVLGNFLAIHSYFEPDHSLVPSSSAPAPVVHKSLLASSHHATQPCWTTHRKRHTTFLPGTDHPFHAMDHDGILG